MGIKFAIDIAGTLVYTLLSGMSGHELAQKIQAKNPRIKTLYIRGYTDSVILNHGIGDEPVNLLQKPFTIGQLTSKISRILANIE